MMLRIFYREVYVGLDESAFERVKACLTDAGIVFSAKVTSPSDRWSVYRPRTRGGFGLNTTYTHQFEVRVRPDDYEQACYLLRGQSD